MPVSLPYEFSKVPCKSLPQMSKTIAIKMLPDAKINNQSLHQGNKMSKQQVIDVAGRWIGALGCDFSHAEATMPKTWPKVSLLTRSPRASSHLAGLSASNLNERNLGIYR